MPRTLTIPPRQEIALGPKGAFENGNIGALTRWVAAGRVVRVVPLPRGKPQREPKRPKVAELLRKAIEWRDLLDSGKIATRASFTVYCR